MFFSVLTLSLESGTSEWEEVMDSGKIPMEKLEMIDRDSDFVWLEVISEMWARSWSEVKPFQTCSQDPSLFLLEGMGGPID